MKFIHIGIILLFGFTTIPNDDIKVQLFGEIVENCGDNKSIDRSLNWYGVYFTEGKGEFIKKIDPRILDVSEREKMYATSGKYDKNGRSWFYLGINKILEEKEVSFLGGDYTKQHYILYPGESHTIYLKGQSTSPPLKIFATGNVIDIAYCPIIENYGVKITSSIQNSKSTRQELYKDIQDKGECGLVEIKWFGDLDDDDKVDFLLATSSTQGTEISLFLSGSARNGNYVNYVDNFHFGNCN